MRIKIALDSCKSTKESKAVDFILTFSIELKILLFLTQTPAAVMLFFITVKCDSQEISLGRRNVIQAAVFTFFVEKAVFWIFFLRIVLYIIYRFYN